MEEDSRMNCRLGLGVLLAALVLFETGCASRYVIRTFPAGANVYVKDVVTQEKKLIGPTPLTLKKTKDMGDVFFLAFEKDNFFPKQVLMTPRDGENFTVSVNLDPMVDGKGGKAGEGGNGEGQQGGQQSPSDAKKKEEDAKELQLRVALLENTVAIYKDALFSARYAPSGGPASFDRDRNDQIVDHLFKGQQLVAAKKYNEALAEIDQAIMKDEYLPQAHLIKGSIFYVNKQYEQAKLEWERTLKIDPYNGQAYQYLRLVSRKLNQAMPPERPSMLRVPAADAFSTSLRQNDPTGKSKATP
jgi:tetratricopeptide (TPR) repeat protein